MLKLINLLLFSISLFAQQPVIENNIRSTSSVGCGSFAPTATGRVACSPPIGNWLTLLNPPFVDSRRYNFTPQQPGGSLTAGSRTISMLPCPFGVAGTDLNHYLYLSGGSGTAEASIITSGSCTPGAASGTITLTVNNSHSGAWTVASATSGIQEAIYASSKYSTIRIQDSNTLTLHQTITVPDGYSIYGGSPYITQITVDQGSWVAINVTGVVDLSGFSLISTGTSNAGTTHANAAIAFVNVGNAPPNSRVRDISISGFATGVSILNSLVEAKDVLAFGVSSVGFLVSGGPGGIASLFGDKLQASGWGSTNGGIGYKYLGTVPGALLTNSNVTSIGTGFQVFPSVNGPVNELQMDQIQIDGTGVGFDIEGGRVAGGIIGQGWVLSNFKYQGTNQAIIVHSGYQNILFSNWDGYTSNNDWATVFGALGITFSGCRMHSAISGANAHAAVDIVADTDGSVASNIEVLSSHVGGDVAGGINSYFNYGIFTDTAAHGDITASGSWIHGAANPVSFNGTGPVGTVYSAAGSKLYTGTVTLAASPIANTTAGSAIVVLNGNAFGGELGVDTVASVAGNTITLPASQVNTILVSADGSGGVATITGPNGTQWIGRRVRITATHANGIVFNTSGNIRATKTLTVGQSSLVEWDGSKWNIN